METLKKKFGSFTATLQENDDRPNVYDCWVSHGRYSSSLGLVEGEGIIEHEFSGEERMVPERIVDRIAEWAVGHGY